MLMQRGGDAAKRGWTGRRRELWGAGEDVMNALFGQLTNAVAVFDASCRCDGVVHQCSKKRCGSRLNLGEIEATNRRHSRSVSQR